MKFKFSLESLLRYREIKEKELQGQLAKSIAKIEMYKSEVEKLNIDINKIHNDFNSYIHFGYLDQINKSITVNKNHFLRFFPYAKELREKKIQYYQYLIDEENLLMSKIQSDLNNAHKDVQIVDKLKEKKEKEFKQKIEQLEEKELEDNKLLSFSRNIIRK